MASMRASEARGLGSIPSIPTSFMKCEKCGNEHDGSFGSGRFCSRSCANSKTYTEDRRIKLKETMKTRSSWYKDGRSRLNLVCRNCGKPAKQSRKHNLCAKCLPLDGTYRKQLSKSTKGICGGYRHNAGRGKTGKYNGFTYQSTWELAWIKYNIDHDIKFERCTEHFTYCINNESHEYYPDFKIGETYYEISGWIDERKIAKISQFPKDKTLVVLGKNEIKPYLEYSMTHSSIG